MVRHRDFKNDNVLTASRCLDSILLVPPHIDARRLIVESRPILSQPLLLREVGTAPKQSRMLFSSLVLLCLVTSGLVVSSLVSSLSKLRNIKLHSRRRRRS
jgi:hypothetical protein